MSDDEAPDEAPSAWSRRWGKHAAEAKTASVTASDDAPSAWSARWGKHAVTTTAAPPVVSPVLAPEAAPKKKATSEAGLKEFKLNDGDDNSDSDSVGGPLDSWMQTVVTRSERAASEAYEGLVADGSEGVAGLNEDMLLARGLLVGVGDPGEGDAILSDDEGGEEAQHRRAAARAARAEAKLHDRPEDDPAFDADSLAEARTILRTWQAVDKEAEAIRKQAHRVAGVRQREREDREAGGEGKRGAGSSPRGNWRSSHERAMHLDRARNRVLRRQRDKQQRGRGAATSTSSHPARGRGGRPPVSNPALIMELRHQEIAARRTARRKRQAANCKQDSASPAATGAGHRHDRDDVDEDGPGRGGGAFELSAAQRQDWEERHASTALGDGGRLRSEERNKTGIQNLWWGRPGANVDLKDASSRERRRGTAGLGAGGSPRRFGGDGRSAPPSSASPRSKQSAALAARRRKREAAAKEREARARRELSAARVRREKAALERRRRAVAGANRMHAAGQKRDLGRCFLAWQTEAQQLARGRRRRQRRVSTAVASRRAKLQRVVLAAWHALAAAQSADTAAAAARADAWRNWRTLTRSWRSWAFFARHARAERARERTQLRLRQQRADEQRADKHHRGRLLSLVLVRWLNWTLASRQQRRLKEQHSERVAKMERLLQSVSTREKTKPAHGAESKATERGESQQVADRSSERGRESKSDVEDEHQPGNRASSPRKMRTRQAAERSAGRRLNATTTSQTQQKPPLAKHGPSPRSRETGDSQWERRLKTHTLQLDADAFPSGLGKKKALPSSGSTRRERGGAGARAGAEVQGKKHRRRSRAGQKHVEAKEQGRARRTRAGTGARRAAAPRTENGRNRERPEAERAPTPAAAKKPSAGAVEGVGKGHRVKETMDERRRRRLEKRRALDERYAQRRAAAEAKRREAAEAAEAEEQVKVAAAAHARSEAKRARQAAEARREAQRELSAQQRMLARMHHARSTMYYRGWLPWLELRRRAKLREIKADRYCAYILKDHALRCWRFWLRQRKQRRLAAQLRAQASAVEWHLDRVLRSSFLAWRRLHERLVRAAASAEVLDQMTCARRHWRAWRRTAARRRNVRTQRERRLLRDASEMGQAALARRCLLRWEQNAAASRRLKRATKRKDATMNKVQGWLAEHRRTTSKMATRR